MRSLAPLTAMETPASLLLMPDISGFTAFVHATELEHSQQIISGLLETLIAADRLDLSVAEVEGDAVLFYKEGQVPPPERILYQARRMFGAFHAWVADYQRTCHCTCAACQAVGQLTLKVVAHAGPLGFTTVRQQRKPFGSAVITLHRLLKNDVPSHEYLLLTDDLLGTGRPAARTWAGAQTGSARYDGLGEVGYLHLSLRDSAPAPEPAAPRAPQFSFRGLWDQLVHSLPSRTNAN